MTQFSYLSLTLLCLGFAQSVDASKLTVKGCASKEGVSAGLKVRKLCVAEDYNANSPDTGLRAIFYIEKNKPAEVWEYVQPTVVAQSQYGMTLSLQLRYLGLFNEESSSLDSSSVMERPLGKAKIKIVMDSPEGDSSYSFKGKLDRNLKFAFDNFEFKE